MLEYLELENQIVAFPHPDYISSEKTRARIDSGKIKDLGFEHTLNTELVIALAPELVIGFSATGYTKAYDLIEKTGIPVVMNGSWMEKHPLGRTEWIKFIAAFYNKEKEAEKIFEKIASNYNKAKKTAALVKDIPTILFGSEYNDVWYMPGGHSYKAKLLEDAHTSYIWKENKKSGSIQLNFESVLEKAQSAQYWLGSIPAKTLNELHNQNNKVELFESFKNESVYSSSLIKGKTGGILFYELGSIHPDLILKDIIKITHPELLPDYSLSFFKKLN